MNIKGKWFAALLELPIMAMQAYALDLGASDRTIKLAIN